jgi:phosphate acetyltransferase
VSTSTEITGRLIGLSRDEVQVGLTASIDHVPQDRSFDLVAAFFGTAASGRDHLPDAAYILLVQGIVLDFSARRLPGPGCEILAQELRFVSDPIPGDRIIVNGAMTARPTEGTAAIALMLESRRGYIAEGILAAGLPAERVVLRPEAQQDIILHHHRHLDQLLRRSTASPPLTVAVAWPCDRDSLLGPLEAHSHGAMQPILVGPRAAGGAVAATARASLDGCELIEAATPHEAVAIAARLCREGRVRTLMKGSPHNGRADGRRRGTRGCPVRRPPDQRRLRHGRAIVPQTTRHHRCRDQHRAGSADPSGHRSECGGHAARAGQHGPEGRHPAGRQPEHSSTLGAAALCKMADRGQISRAILDGPLASDNAISRAAAEVKKIALAVAGDADILVAPDLEAGNMMAKQLSYLAGADSAGIVLGARVPVILASGADSVTSRLASVALARLLAAASAAGREARP